MPYSTEQSNKAFAGLPLKVQEFVMSSVVADLIQIVEEEHSIPAVKSDDFTLKIFALLTYTYFPEEFMQDLQHEYSISEDIAMDILIDVYDLILEPAGYVLDREDGEDMSGEASEENPQTPQDDTSSLQKHLLDEIENPLPSPLVSQKPNPAFSLLPANQAATIQPYDLPAARVIPPINPNTINTVPTAASAAKPVPMATPTRPAPWNSMTAPQADQSKQAPSILIQQVDQVHNLDHGATISEHEEDLMPLIIENSKYARFQEKLPTVPAQNQQRPVVQPQQSRPMSDAPQTLSIGSRYGSLGLRCIVSGAIDN